MLLVSKVDLDRLYYLSCEHNDGKCDVISEKGPYCGRNSVFQDQLFLHFCDSISFFRTAQGARKMFPLDAH